MTRHTRASVVTKTILFSLFHFMLLLLTAGPSCGQEVRTFKAWTGGQLTASDTMAAFNIELSKAIECSQLDLFLNLPNRQTSFEIYYRSGTANDNLRNTSGWTFHGDTSWNMNPFGSSMGMTPKPFTFSKLTLSSGLYGVVIKERVQPPNASQFAGERNSSSASVTGKYTSPDDGVIQFTSVGMLESWGRPLSRNVYPKVTFYYTVLPESTTTAPTKAPNKPPTIAPTKAPTRRPISVRSLAPANPPTSAPVTVAPTPVSCIATKQPCKRNSGLACCGSSTAKNTNVCRRTTKKKKRKLQWNNKFTCEKCVPQNQPCIEPFYCCSKKCKKVAGQTGKRCA